MHAECEAIVLPPMVQPIHLEKRTNSETNQKVRHPSLLLHITYYKYHSFKCAKSTAKSTKHLFFTTELLAHIGLLLTIGAKGCKLYIIPMRAHNLHRKRG